MHEDELTYEYRVRIQRLVNIHTGFRWVFVVFLWLTIGAASLWHIRDSLILMADFFTWSAVRAIITYDRWAALGIVLCVSVTLSTLVWQSQHILRGFSRQEYQDLISQVRLIEKAGKKHPLWRWICHRP